MAEQDAASADESTPSHGSTPSGDPADRLTLARRRAFSRGATPADVEHLRALEERAAAVSFVIAESADDSVAPVRVDEPATAGLAPDVEAPQPRAPRVWVRPALLGLIGGVLLGILVATVTSPLFGVRRAESVASTGDEPPGAEFGSSLAIFDRTPSERDVLGLATFPDLFDAGSGAPEVRWLADLDGATVYVARGQQAGETAICLVTIRVGTAGAGCSGVAEFEVAGIAATFDSIAVRWGPFGLDPWVPYEPDER